LSESHPKAVFYYFLIIQPILPPFLLFISSS
jgi:hypothetical protein